MNDMSSIAVAERDSNSIIEQQLDVRLSSLEDSIESDALTYIGPLYPPLDDEIKDAVESIESRRPKLTVIIETGGGLITVAERMARIFRHHYKQVEFAVPSHAMSAGTVLVMAGDAIHMDYASVLGPIDPQVKAKSGQWVPALGYLEQYERLIEKSRKGTLTLAEGAFLVQNFDAAELYQYEQECELSIALLEDWLVNFKFKNWKKTSGHGIKVTKAMRVERARQIAEKLQDTKLWHSHSRGIPMDVLRKKLNLLIDDFGANLSYGPLLHDYYRLLKDYGVRRGHTILIHTRGRYVGV